MPSLFPNFIRKKKDGKSPKPSPGKPKPKSRSEGGHSVSTLGPLFMVFMELVLVAMNASAVRWTQKFRFTVFHTVH